MTSLYDIDLVAPEAVLEILGVTPDELMALVNEGRLPAYRIGGSLRFRAIEVAGITAHMAA